MKTIPLTKGRVALVDDEDYERVSNHNWCALNHSTRNKTTYAYRLTKVSEKDISTKGVLLHRFILGITDPKIQIDHNDLNGLNCQKYNMRIATSSQNNANKKGRGKSKYRGVSFHKASRKWVATIKKYKKQIHLGLFDSEDASAKAYDLKAKELHGEFANLNFPESNSATDNQY